MVGMIAMPLPHVLGIDKGVTEAALTVSLPFQILAVVCAAKLIATAISLGFGFGGGVFSPPMLSVRDDLETALKLTRTTGVRHVAVVEDPETRIFAGCLYERDAMSAYNRALLDNRRQERG